MGIVFRGPELERGPRQRDGVWIEVDPPQPLLHDLCRIDTEAEEVVGSGQQERTAPDCGVAHRGRAVGPDGDLRQSERNPGRCVVHALSTPMVGVQRPFMDPSEVPGPHRPWDRHVIGSRQIVDGLHPTTERIGSRPSPCPDDRGRAMPRGHGIIDPGEPVRRPAQDATSVMVTSMSSDRATSGRRSFQITPS